MPKAVQPPTLAAIAVAMIAILAPAAFWRRQWPRSAEALSVYPYYK